MGAVNRLVAYYSRPLILQHTIVGQSLQFDKNSGQHDIIFRIREHFVSMDTVWN